MPRGASPKREREYEELVDSFKKEGRYEGREEEVAARIVNKQRAEHGETQDAKRNQKAGHAPDRNLPIKNYDHLTVEQVAGKLDDLSPQELARIKKYEEEHLNRKTLLEAIERQQGESS